MVLYYIHTHLIASGARSRPIQHPTSFPSSQELSWQESIYLLLELTDLRFFNRTAFEIPHLSHLILRTIQLGFPTHVKIAKSGCGFSAGGFSVALTPIRIQERYTTFLIDHVHTVDTLIRHFPNLQLSSLAWSCWSFTHFLKWRAGVVT
jgi:hypothetical protein